MKDWRCTDCGNVHRTRPGECRACGSPVLEPQRRVEEATTAGKAAIVLTAVFTVGLVGWLTTAVLL
jgi:hypothetical protein